MDLMPDRQSPWRPQRSITCGQNLSKRIKTYPSGLRRSELATYYDTIALFVAEFPTMPITDINQLKHVDSEVALPAGPWSSDGCSLTAKGMVLRPDHNLSVQVRVWHDQYALCAKWQGRSAEASGVSASVRMALMQWSRDQSRSNS
jgi:hypothetical protein